MQEYIQTLEYLTAQGAADFTATGSVAVSGNLYASAAAALAVLNASAVRAVYMDYTKPLLGRPRRALLTAALTGGEDKLANEEIYVVTPARLDGKSGVLLELAASVVWKASAIAVDPTLGGRTNHLWPKQATVTASGLLGARTLAEVQTPAGTPSILTIYDIGPARGLIRLFTIPVGTPATGVAPLGAQWN